MDKFRNVRWEKKVFILSLENYLSVLDIYSRYF